MAVGGSWRIYGSVTGLTQGTEAVDVSITPTSSSVGGRTVQTINGFQNMTTSTPSVATAVIIIPPSGNSNTITLKGVTGDTGIALSKTQPTVVSIVAGTTWGITTGASTVLTFVFL